MNATHRLTWADLPETLIGDINDALGSQVVRADSQSDGFSLGLASRVITDNGSRAFVKAISKAQAADGYRLYASEAEILEILPTEVPVPRLLATIVRDEWIALIIEDVDGSQPSIPPTRDELLRVLDAVGAFPSAEGLGLHSIGEELSTEFETGWPSIVADQLTIPAWAAENAAELAELAASAPAYLEGDRLVHLDLRADNVLFDREGKVLVVDWPWAVAGAAWVDGLTLLMDARMNGSHLSDALVHEHPLFASVVPEAIDAFLAGLAVLPIDVIDAFDG